MPVHGFFIISLSMIWQIKKVFVDENELDSTPAPSLKKYVRQEKRNGASCYYIDGNLWKLV